MPTLKVRVYLSDQSGFELWQFPIPARDDRGITKNMILRDVMGQLVEAFPGNEFEVTSPAENLYEIKPHITYSPTGGLNTPGTNPQEPSCQKTQP